MAEMTEAQRREVSREIIRAAAFVECASALDMRAQRYASTIRGRVGLQIANSIRQEADHLRDRAAAIKNEADAITKSVKAGESGRG